MAVPELTVGEAPSPFCIPMAKQSLNVHKTKQKNIKIHHVVQ